MDDISELADIDLTGKYIAAVKNAFMKYYPSELSHLSKENYEKLKDSYFGGGIWILNLEKIRQDNLENKMISIIRDNTIIKKWNDQDVMNLACDNKVEYLSLRYISYPYLPDLLKNKEFVSHYSNSELIESIENPKILHYAAMKPWNGDPNKAEIWWNIYRILKLPKTRIFTKRPSKTKRLSKVELLKNILRKIKLGVGVILRLPYYLKKKGDGKWHENG
jgi:lipopolysaccharide biosynthesis glycosyltransferase